MLAVLTIRRSLRSHSELYKTVRLEIRFWLCARNNSNNAHNANNTGNTDNNNFYNSKRCISALNLIKKEKMVNIEDIIDAYLICRSTKRRSGDSIDYEMHYERNLVRLHYEIENRSLRPSAYTFVTLKPCPREVFASDYGTRVVHHYLDIRMRPLLEKRMTDRSFNNRKGFGPDVAVNRFISDLYEVTEGFTKQAWVISADLQGYFPNVDQNIVYSQLREVIETDYSGNDKDELHYMLLSCVFSNPTRHCVRVSPLHKWEYIERHKSVFTKPDGIGGAIGFLLWQIALNYLLNDFDKAMVETYGFHYVRYVDDMKWVVLNKDAFLPMMQEVRNRLSELHCTLHPRKFSCQQADKKLNFIGKHICCDRVHCSARVVRNAERAIRGFNKCPTEWMIERFLCSINSYMGLLKGCDNYNVIVKLTGMLNKHWLKYVHFNKKRLCYCANDGYRHKELLAKKYKLKIDKLNKKRNGDNRKNQRTGKTAA